jgi:hypothetical protein
MSEDMLLAFERGQAAAPMA